MFSDVGYWGHYPLCIAHCVLFFTAQNYKTGSFRTDCWGTVKFKEGLPFYYPFGIIEHFKESFQVRRHILAAMFAQEFKTADGCEHGIFF